MTTFLTAYAIVGVGIVAFIARMVRSQRRLEISLEEFRQDLADHEASAKRPRAA